MSEYRPLVKGFESTEAQRKPSRSRMWRQQRLVMPDLQAKPPPLP